MRFTRAQLEALRGATLPDVLGPGVRLLFVGINPGLWTVAVQAHFARPGNRFYPALLRGGVVDRLIDASRGYTPADLAGLTSRGIAITNLVARATARAEELSRDELVAGARALEQRIPRIAPKVVAVLGITAFRTAFERPSATIGRQAEDFGGAELWVVPNPSGLNAHSRIEDFARAFREVAVAAGIPVEPR